MAETAERTERQPYKPSPTADAEELTKLVRTIPTDPIFHLRARRIAAAIPHMNQRDALIFLTAVAFNNLPQPFLFPDEE